MCDTGNLVLALKFMNARWHYRGHRSMSVMKVVNGIVSMGMMSIVKMVVPCHSFVHVSVLLCFLDF